MQYTLPHSVCCKKKLNLFRSLCLNLLDTIGSFFLFRHNNFCKKKTKSFYCSFLLLLHCTASISIVCNFLLLYNTCSHPITVCRSCKCLYFVKENTHTMYSLVVFSQFLIKYFFLDDIAAPSISQSSKLEDAWASGLLRPIAAYRMPSPCLCNHARSCLSCPTQYCAR